MKVTDDVHMISGLGSNVGVLRTRDGALVVDTMTFAMQGRAIREHAEKLAGPVQVLVNTHYHLDHTHGNPAFAPGTGTPCCGGFTSNEALATRPKTASAISRALHCAARTSQRARRSAGDSGRC